MKQVISPDTAVQLVFLVEGVDETVAAWQKAHPHKDHPITAAGGHIGMVIDLLPYATLVSDYIARMVGKQDFPGVIEYEVTSELGAWLANNWVNFDNHLPDLFAAELEKQGAEFFSQ